MKYLGYNLLNLINMNSNEKTRQQPEKHQQKVLLEGGKQAPNKAHP